MKVTSPLWPYDEVEVSLEDLTQEKPDGPIARFHIKTPWMQAHLPIDEELKPILEGLVKKFQDKTLQGADLPMINAVFKSVSHYPFCYTLPFQKNLNECDHHQICDDTLLEADLKQVLQSIWSSCSSHHDNKDVDQTLKEIHRQEFDWDQDTALQFAKIGDGFHPESLFSVARRFHLIEVMNADNGIDIFGTIKELPPKDYKRASALILRQNHYVTQHCNSSLSPATHCAGKAKHLVEEFVKEEDGHDKILGKAMMEMTDRPESITVTATTQSLMLILQYAARRNFLAFAMIVDAFERSTYEDKDPIATLLDSGGFDKAARLVNRHKDINDAGGHENIAQGFLIPMAPVTEAYAREALKLTELASLLHCGVTRSAWRVFEESR